MLIMSSVETLSLMNFSLFYENETLSFGNGMLVFKVMCLCVKLTKSAVVTASLHYKLE